MTTPNMIITIGLFTCTKRHTIAVTSSITFFSWELGSRFGRAVTAKGEWGTLRLWLAICNRDHLIITVQKPMENHWWITSSKQSGSQWKIIGIIAKVTCPKIFVREIASNLCHWQLQSLDWVTWTKLNEVRKKMILMERTLVRGHLPKDWTMNSVINSTSGKTLVWMALAEVKSLIWGHLPQDIPVWFTGSHWRIKKKWKEIVEHLLKESKPGRER